MPELDNYVEEHSSSWGSRIMGSIKGIGTGFVLFLVSFGILFWNEGRAVTTARSLEEGKKKVISVSNEAVDSQNENKLIHISGQAVTDNKLADSEFGIELCALHLKRIVEMYQWKEDKKTHKTSDGKTRTEYSYHKVWSDYEIDSQKFKRQEGHINPPMPLKGIKRSASEVKVGAFWLNSSLIQGISSFEDITITAAHLEKLPEGMKNLKLFENYFYRGNEPLNPKIGDARIRFQYVKPGTTVSVIAQQTGNTFCPYPTKAGRPIEMISIGQITAHNMFQTALSQNAMLTWLLRLAGFLVMLFGMMLILNPLMTLVDVIPIVRDFVGMGVFLISLLVSLVFSLLTVSIAWFFYRPELSLALIAIAIALIVFGRNYSLKKQPTL